MRARALILGILSSAVVLAAGWQLGICEQPAVAGGEATIPAPTTSGSSSSLGGSTAPKPAPTAFASSSPSASQGAGGVSGTFTGASTRTRYGNVQVQITVQNGAITDVTALHLTDDDGRSVSISNRAAPILCQQVLAAQSANVQGVSGATYTTDGYLTSLQSAIDQAGL